MNYGFDQWATTSRSNRPSWLVNYGLIVLMF